MNTLTTASIVREGSQAGASSLWWKRSVEKWVSSLEWNSECAMEGGGGEPVEDGFFHDLSIVKVKRATSPKQHI